MDMLCIDGIGRECWIRVVLGLFDQHRLVVGGDASLVGVPPVAGICGSLLCRGRLVVVVFVVCRGYCQRRIRYRRFLLLDVFVVCL